MSHINKLKIDLAKILINKGIIPSEAMLQELIAVGTWPRPDESIS